ncbi:MAG: nicotinate phosphoribosyltransferase, partial [Acidobacteriota bacterium]|nr:nicotinate phosphoribosyltransferase [Acidobacteriota bacterium]
RDIGTFEFTIRRLPRDRDFVLLAGLHRAVDYLLNLGFAPEEIAYLRGLENFRNASPAFWDYLANFRFTGDVFAVPEGRVVYEGQPVLNIRAPLCEGQIPETYLLSCITFETLVASKAARVVHAARGRDVIEFGTRRAHTPEAGVLGARAAYIAGCAGTSNTLAGFRYGIPVMGTAAHSWVLSFQSECEAFRQLQNLLGERTIQLIDTYDTENAARLVGRMGGPLWGVRLDSGDFLSLSKHVRSILDDAGLSGAKIMASGDLDEHRIEQLIGEGAPIDAFGAGTEIAVSADAPSMGAIYKLVEIEGRPTAKLSQDKQTVPGAKQLFRYPEYDILGLHDECAGGSEAMLKPIVIGGRLTRELPGVEAIREKAQRNLAPWPAGRRHTKRSLALQELHESLLRH